MKDRSTKEPDGKLAKELIQGYSSTSCPGWEGEDTHTHTVNFWGIKLYTSACSG